MCTAMPNHITQKLIFSDHLQAGVDLFGEDELDLGALGLADVDLALLQRLGTLHDVRHVLQGNNSIDIFGVVLKDSRSPRLKTLCTIQKPY